MSGPARYSITKLIAMYGEWATLSGYTAWWRHQHSVTNDEAIEHVRAWLKIAREDGATDYPLLQAIHTNVRFRAHFRRP